MTCHNPRFALTRSTRSISGLVNSTQKPHEASITAYIKMLYLALITQQTQNNLTQVQYTLYTRNDEIVSKTGNLTSYTTRQTIASCIYIPSTHSFRIRKVLDLSYEDNLTQTSLVYTYVWIERARVGVAI